MKKAATKQAAPKKTQPVLVIPPPSELTLSESPWNPYDGLTDEERREKLRQDREVFRIEEQESEWHRVTKLLQENGRFVDIDQRGLIQLCKLFGMMRLAEREILIDGMTTVQHTGYGDNIVPHPMNANYRTLAKEYRTMLRAFGLLPDGRVKPKPAGNALGGRKKGEPEKPMTLTELQELLRQNLKRPRPGAAKKRAK